MDDHSADFMLLATYLYPTGIEHVVSIAVINDPRIVT